MYGLQRKANIEAIRSGVPYGIQMRLVSNGCIFFWNKQMGACFNQFMKLKSQIYTDVFQFTFNLAKLPSQLHSLHSLFSHESSEHLLSDAWYENKVRHDRRPRISGNNEQEKHKPAYMLYR
jgi:hypothetical protein